MNKVELIAWSLLVAFVWGLSPILNKKLIKDGLPVEFIFAAVAVCYALCVTVFILFNRRLIMAGLRKASMSHYATIVAIGVLSAFIGNIVFIKLLSKHRDSYVVTALTFISPVFTLALAYLFLKEEVTLISGLGVLLVVAGIVMVASK